MGALLFKKELAIGFLLVSQFVFAQNEKLRSNEVSVTVDNDILLLLDHYYTAGQSARYSRISKVNKVVNLLKGRSDTTSRFTVHYEYGNKIFTPIKISFSDVKFMDRPYAGWSYISSGMTKFKSTHRAVMWNAELGLVGPASGMGKLHRWWHEKTHYPKPKGWEYQIGNEVVLNISYNQFHRLKLDDHIDFVFNSGIYAGTGNNRLTEMVTFRFGDPNSLSNSALTNGRLGARKPEYKDEFFLFIGGGVDYVFSNIFIEGSLFKNSSPLTAQLTPLLIRKNFGLMHSNDKTTFCIAFNFLSKELTKGQKHGYASIIYAVRF